MNEYEEKVIDELVKKVPVEQAYEDLASPSLKETGKLIEKIPRAINAALAPVEKWILQKEYSVKETKILLEKKLSNLNETEIIVPEAYIAIPAMQAIEYCYDSEILRDMYASLLANSMDKNVYKCVHPSYVEIIKQLSPDEVRILNQLPESGLREPLLDIEVTKVNRNGVFLYCKNMTTFAYECECERPENISNYIENLTRLGLVEIPPFGTLVDEWRYDKIYDSNGYKDKIVEAENKYEITDIKANHKCFGITDFGSAFRDICKR